MAILTRFGGSGGGTPISDPYPHVWECTVVQSGTIGVVSGVVNLEAYDILHYTMPLGFSTYDLMIGGTTYTTSFLNDGEMYIQWDGNDFVEVAASAGCTLPHVWTSPTYTITGSVLEITGGVDDLRTNDVIVLTLGSGESASVIEYNSTNYVINGTIDDTNTYYLQFNGTTFDIGLFTFLGNATAADVATGKTFYGNSSQLLTGSYVPTPSNPKFLDDIQQRGQMTLSSGTNTYTISNCDVNKLGLSFATPNNCTITAVSATQSGSDCLVSVTCTNTPIMYWYESDTYSVDSRTFGSNPSNYASYAENTIDNDSESIFIGSVMAQVSSRTYPAFGSGFRRLDNTAFIITGYGNTYIQTVFKRLI